MGLHSGYDAYLRVPPNCYIDPTATGWVEFSVEPSSEHSLIYIPCYPLQHSD
jgi:hypothetical protein